MRRTLTSVWGRSWPEWSNLAVWPTLLPFLLFLFLLSYPNRNLSSLHLHPFVPFGSIFFLSLPFQSCSGLFLLLVGGLGGHSSPTLSLFLEDKFGDFQYMARSPVAVDVQLAMGLGPPPFSSLSWLPSWWLEGRPHTTLLYGEPQPNRMASDAMDHPIHVLCVCMHGWDLGSKYSAA